MVRTMSKAAQDRSDNLYWTRDSSSVALPASTSSSLISFDGQLAAALGETARNWTIERIIGNLVLSIPASTAPGRSYSAFLGIDILPVESITDGSYPEPFSEQGIQHPWVEGRTVFADHTVPASYASPGINGIIQLDMRSKRRAKGSGFGLRMFGYHDNGLSANPVMYFTYSALWRLR